MDQKFPSRPPHLKTIFDKFDPLIYFIKICTFNRLPILANDTFHDHFRSYFARKSSDGIACGEYVIMPDHFHLFFRIDPHQYQLGATIGFIKKSLSKPLREAGIPMPHWQNFFFDHVLRSADSYSSKWEYVRDNPVRAGLVDLSEGWKFQGCIVPLKF